MPGMPGAMMPTSSKLESNVSPVAVASTASTTTGMVITYNVTHISGTAAVVLFNLPSGFRGIFVLIPDANFTGATGGTYSSDGVTDSVPIGLAFTAVTGRVLTMVCDGKLVYPSYVS